MYSKCIFLSDLSSKKIPQISLIFLRSACTSSYQDFRKEWQLFVFSKLKIAHLDTWIMQEFGSIGLWVYFFVLLCHTVQYLFRYSSWKYQDKEKSVHKLRDVYRSDELPCSLRSRDYSFVVVEHLFYGCYKKYFIE